jgi:hypothetical protein
MKKIVLILLLLSFTFSSYSQRITKDLSEATYYLQKSKKQKTAGWLLLSGGTVMCASGYVVFIYEGLQGDGIYGTKAKLALAMFYAGGAAIVGSIPLFIASARNKGISMSATTGLKMENNISQLQPSFVKASYPALSLKINLK